MDFKEDVLRLNKYMAMCGVGSRREADGIIAEGRVLVNGSVAEAGTKVAVGDVVTLDGKVIKIVDNRVVYACYKPVGVTCTAKDEHADKTLSDVFKFEHRVTYAGRLDKNSEGLLLMTNDGVLIDKLMRGRNGHEKEYIVKVDKLVTKDFLEKMSKGVALTDINVTTKPCVCEKIDDSSFSIILTEGLNRQIRRMCASFGMNVTYLKRIRVANVLLGDMKPGDIRLVEKEELLELLNCIEE